MAEFWITISQNGDDSVKAFPVQQVTKLSPAVQMGESA